MQADEEQEDDRRMLGQMVYDICRPFDGDGLEVVGHHIHLAEGDTGKTVPAAHFRSSHDNAAHAVIRAHIDAVRARDKHADMDDVPRPVDRSVVLQSLGKWQRILRFICFYSVHRTPVLFCRCDHIGIYDFARYAFQSSDLA